VLALQLELCLPRLVSSPAPGGLIDGLRAFSRNPGRRASPATLLLSGGRIEGTGCVAAPGRSARRLDRGHSRKLRQVPVDNKVHRVRRLYGGWTLSDESVRTLVGNSDQPVDEAVLGRLRHAITSDGGEEEQLNGVLRMLGAEAPSKNQLPLFGKAPAGQAPKATTKTVDGA